MFVEELQEVFRVYGYQPFLYAAMPIVCLVINSQLDEMIGFKILTAMVVFYLLTVFGQSVEPSGQEPRITAERMLYLNLVVSILFPLSLFLSLWVLAGGRYFLWVVVGTGLFIALTNQELVAMVVEQWPSLSGMVAPSDSP
ncbi:MAG: hypothetical protein AAF183_08860 [Pseudomonadota bacterium]